MENVPQDFVSQPIINNSNNISNSNILGWKKLSLKGKIFYYFMFFLELFFLFIVPFLGILGEDREKPVLGIFSTLIMLAIFPVAFIISIGGMIVGFIYCFRKKAYFAGSFLLVLSLLTFPAISLFLERIPLYRNIIISIDEKKETTLIADLSSEINYETKKETQNQQAVVVKDESPISPTPPIFVLKPYQVRFISPENNIKVPLNGSVQIKIQVGEKIKKVKLNFATYNLSPQNNLKDIEIPVQSGYANYVFNVRDTTLVPITIGLGGIADDMLAYTQAEYGLTEKEVMEMFRTIQLYTDKKPETFVLEDKNFEVNRILLNETKPAPQFLSGFPGFGIVAIYTSDIQFNIADPSIIELKKTAPISFKGLKQGSTKVTVTYKGFFQEIFYIVE